MKPSAEVQRLALGTVQFGLPYGIANARGQLPGDEAKAIIRFAESRGISSLDTAFAYGDSETMLGEIGVSDWTVISKLPVFDGKSDEVDGWVQDRVENSLQRMRIQSMHGLLLHRPQQLLGKHGEQIYRRLQDLKSRGKVAKIGVSIYDPAELNEICSRYAIDIVQAPLNLLDRRMVDSEWYSRLLQDGVELHIRSVFLQGLLLMPAAQRPEKFSRWQTLWHGWDDWLKASDLTALQACLQFVLSFTGVDKVIVGVDSLQQLSEIVDATAQVSLEVPDSLRCSDLDLINPANWGSL